MATIHIAFFSARLSTTQDANNMGLYDQIAALNWVRNNIGFFGGNSSAVTVLGHGSGATSVGYHMLSPTSSWHHFIKRFILMSHSPYTRQTDTVERAKSKTVALSSALGCGDALEDLPGAVDCMRPADVSAVLNASAPSSERPTLLFFPTHGTELMPVKPSLMFSAAGIKGREVLIGNTASEGNYELALIDAIQGEHHLFESSVVEHTTRMLRWLGVPNPEMVVAVYQDKLALTGQEWARRVFADVLSACPQFYFAEQLAPNNYVYNYVINRALSYQRWHGPPDHAGNRVRGPAAVATTQELGSCPRCRATRGPSLTITTWSRSSWDGPSRCFSPRDARWSARLCAGTSCSGGDYIAHNELSSL
ncbi:hypothetical protein HPB48_007077 [Haemaphysalis longicornis]|uniref:Carboxylesterase type B domain-containing protein n=1 Tax=Haemaphysalis longicornis TaxID=44386 RepID=A0A9J6G297_HAELO|nr:hypothetical protein HPB48_007077 [Haemaphysalis longicornis]